MGKPGQGPGPEDDPVDPKASGERRRAAGSGKKRRAKAAPPAAAQPAEPASTAAKKAKRRAKATAGPERKATDAALHAEGHERRRVGERSLPVLRHDGSGAAHAADSAPQPPITPPPPPVETGSEYGPSIDRPVEVGLRSRLVEGLRRLEERARAHLVTTRAEPGRKVPALEFVWRRYRSLAMRDRSQVVDEFGRDPHVCAAFDPYLDFLYRTWFRVSVSGIEHVPDEGRALIVANHSGSLPYDGGMIMQAVRKEHPARRDVRPLVEDFVFHFPYLGTLVNRIGGVRACQENAERLLRQDQLVAVFPEGIKGIGKLFSERYRLQRFGRGGFVKLALATETPIIPTAVVGAEEIHPMLTKVTFFSKALHIPYLPITPTFPWLGPLGLLPLPTKWFVAFGEPLYFNAEYGAAAAEDRILVNKLAEQVRQRIQEMIDGLLQRRRSVLFG